MKKIFRGIVAMASSILMLTSAVNPVMAENVDGANLALLSNGANPFHGGPAGQSISNVQEFINDGKYDTADWINSTTSGVTAFGQYFGVDFGNPTEFNKVVYYVKPTGTSSRITGAVIQVSDDKTNWKDIPGTTYPNVTDMTTVANNNTFMTSVIFKPQTARYVRVYVTNGSNPQLMEFEVYNAQLDHKVLGVGDYVIMGKDRASDDTLYDMYWRVIDVDQNGPLLISDRTLAMYKEYDAPGLNTTGNSHGRSNYRITYGSNFWDDSNIRDWLNSGSTAGNVEYSCGNLPTYSDYEGFLNNFTATEIQAMKTVAQKNIISIPDNVEGIVEGGSNYHLWNTVVGQQTSSAVNYSTAYYNTINDKIFLPDVKDVELMNKYSGILGEKYYIGKTVGGTSVMSWLRTPFANSDQGVDTRVVLTDSSIRSSKSFNSTTNQSTKWGVRPMMYLDETALSIGTGTLTNPYMISSSWNINKIEKVGEDISVYVNVESDGNHPCIILATYDENNCLVNAYFDFITVDDFEENGTNTSLAVTNFPGADVSGKTVRAFVFKDVLSDKPMAQIFGRTAICARGFNLTRTPEK